MKIQIVQREIEEAIRAYIHSQINVKEGMEITMEFTSTRGDDGLVAAIDISPAKQPEPVKRATRAAPVVTATRSAPEPKEDVRPSISETPEDRVEPEAATVASSNEDDGDEDNRPLRPSIFTNLRRPQNDEAEGAAA